MTLTQAGLCEGYGGLTLAVAEVFDAELAWYSEIEPAACRVSEHHYPGLLNVGDITRVGLDFSDEEWAAMCRRAEIDENYELPAPDWSDVEPVDILAAGFPCQDVSVAGELPGCCREHVPASGAMSCAPSLSCDPAWSCLRTSSG